ncbi:MAG: sporulation integral membrane protein YtvI [Clostridia bacterium]
MNLPENESLKRFSMIFICSVAVAAVGYLSIKYVLPVIFPFVFAWIVAFALQRPINFLTRKIKIPKKISVPILVLIFIAFISFVLYLVINRAYNEAISLSQNVSSLLERIKTDENLANEWIEKINSIVPFVDVRDRLTAIWANIDDSIENLMISIVEKLSDNVIPILSGLLAFVPNALLYIFMTVISTYYFAVDFDGINRRVVSLLPKKSRKYASIAKSELKGTLGNFLRAYTLIIMITFTELFVFFTVMEIRFAFLIAFFVSLIDILPVLGTGTVLIPWAVILLISGNTYMGIAILVAYAFITIVREIIEPRIIGKCMGISPLPTLIAMYIGLNFFGIIGIFLCPMAVIMAKNIYATKKKDTATE